MPLVADMADDIATQVIVMALTGVMGAFGGWIIHRLKALQRRQEEHDRRRDEEMAALKAGMVCTLRADLVDMHRRYVVEGNPCPVSEQERAEEAYRAYHTLEGNGTGTHLYEEIRDLAMVGGRPEWRAAHHAGQEA